LDAEVGWTYRGIERLSFTPLRKERHGDEKSEVPSLKEVVVTLTRAHGGVKAKRCARFGSGIFKRTPPQATVRRLREQKARAKTTEGVLDCTSVCPSPGLRHDDPGFVGSHRSVSQENAVSFLPVGAGGAVPASDTERQRWD